MGNNKRLNPNKVANIGFESYPKQSEEVGKPVKVCFGLDLSNQIDGILIRDDAEEPYVTIIRLDDGRYILDTECQYNK